MPSQPCDTSWQLVLAVTSSLPTLQCSMGKSYSLLCPGAFPTFLVPGMVRPGQRPTTTRYAAQPQAAPLLVNGNLRTSRRVLLRILEQDSDVSSDDESEPPGGSSEDVVHDEVCVVDSIEPVNEWLRVKCAPPECRRVSAPSPPPDGETEIVDPGDVKVNPGETKMEWRKVTFALMNRARFGIPPDTEYSCHGDVDYDVDKTDLLVSVGGTDVGDGAVVEEGVGPVTNGVPKVKGERGKEVEKVSNRNSRRIFIPLRTTRPTLFLQATRSYGLSSALSIPLHRSNHSLAGLPFDRFVSTFLCE